MKALLFNVVEHSYDMRSLGIYRIAHVLRDESWDVEVIDYANFWSLDQLKQLVRSRYSKDLKFIGVSQLFSHWPEIMEEFTGWLKQTYPHLHIISGSPAYPAFDSRHIDYYVRGFGEYAIIKLLQWLYSNGPRPKFVLPPPGGKKIIDAIIAYPAFPIADLKVSYEDRDFIEPDESLTLETSRGCKFSCDFCSYPVLGVKTDHTRSADDFRDQVTENYDRFGTTKYIITDETFNDRTDKIIKYADVVEKLDFDLFFSAFIRADLLTARPNELEHLLRMKVLGHFYGVESFNTPSAKAVGKGMPGERLKQGLVDIKNYFMSHGSGRYRGTLSFIIGLPHETRDTMNNAKQWVIDNWQGQHFNTYALALQTADLNDSLSKISLDYKSYGYEVDTNELDMSLDQTKYFKNVLNWKNQHMTFSEAISMSDEWVHLKKNYNYGLGAWVLHERYNNAPSIDDLLNAKLKDNLDQTPAHLQRYISKKLDLT